MSNSMVPPSSSSEWDSSADDFGQKVDLAVRIREILRNYPEGPSVLKELLQNADDAGARTFRLCSAAPRPRSRMSSTTSTITNPLERLSNLPSLIAYNSATFAPEDFESIRRIGDSVKKAKGRRTGRFGVGSNSSYHLTDVPVFVSGKKVVIFDPEGRHVPGIDPSNPGKIFDWTKGGGRDLAKGEAFLDPLRAFGWDPASDEKINSGDGEYDGKISTTKIKSKGIFKGKMRSKDKDKDEDGPFYDGTVFRFALRDEAGARTSRLSDRSHTIDDVRELLAGFARAAPSMILFLKNVEVIEIYDWEADKAIPRRVHRTAITANGKRIVPAIGGATMTEVRMARKYILDAGDNIPEKPQKVDYVLDVVSEGIGTESKKQLGEREGRQIIRERVNNENDSTSKNANEYAIDDVNDAYSSVSRAYPLERYLIFSQFGGGSASRLTSNPSLASLRLVPWAGVAARIFPPPTVDSSDIESCNDHNGRETSGGIGTAYCFLPLPECTRLPVHVNGYFELSSNRRGLWWGDDMAGDGRARADWNRSLIADVVAPCYRRLVVAAASMERDGALSSGTWETLLPSFAAISGGAKSSPWALLATRFIQRAGDLPILRTSAAMAWTSPSNCVVLPEEEDNELGEVLALDKQLPIVRFALPGVREFLMVFGACSSIADPPFLRDYLRGRERTDREAFGNRDAMVLLSRCLSDLTPERYEELKGCQLIPLADGTLGTFGPPFPASASSLPRLMEMGFPELKCRVALVDADGDADVAAVTLLTDSTEKLEKSKGSYYYVGKGDGAALLRDRGGGILVDLDIFATKGFDPIICTFFSSSEAKVKLNLVNIVPSLVPDIVERVFPRSWLGKNSVPWMPCVDSKKDNIDGNKTSSKIIFSEGIENHDDANSNSNNANENNDKKKRNDNHCIRMNSMFSEIWFQTLWRFVSLAGDEINLITAYLAAHNHPVVPCARVLCSLSLKEGILDVTGIDVSSILSLQTFGVRILLQNALENVPQSVNSRYVYSALDHGDGHMYGMVMAVEAAVQRRIIIEGSTKKEVWNGPAGDEARNTVYRLAFGAWMRYGGRTEMSPTMLTVLRSLPIFRCIGGGFTSLEGIRYVLKDPALIIARNNNNKKDESDEVVWEWKDCLSSSFIISEGVDESKFLASLGAEIIDLVHLFLDFAVPQFGHANSENNKGVVAVSMAKQALTDLLVECTTNPDVAERVGKTKFVPSAVSGLLLAPIELYDPEVTQLQSLVDPDTFPDLSLCGNNTYLSTLRSLGMRSSLTWDVILECAHSIDEDGISSFIANNCDGDGDNDGDGNGDGDCDDNSDVDEISCDRRCPGQLAAKRGEQLLAFLDVNYALFFPEFKKKSEHIGQVSRLFRKVNKVLFENTEEKLAKKKLHAKRVNILLSLRWVPIRTQSPDPLLPWSQTKRTTEKPSDVVPFDLVWLTSCHRRPIKDDIRCNELRHLFGWDKSPPAKTVATQLVLLGKNYDHQTKSTMYGEKRESIRQRVTAKIPQLYDAIENGTTDDDIDNISAILRAPEALPLWTGDGFVRVDRVAHSPSIHAPPYLLPVPPDLSCFRRVLQFAGIRKDFGVSDYYLALKRMAEETEIKKCENTDNIRNVFLREALDSRKIDIAVGLVQRISDDESRGLGDMEIFVPTEENKLELASEIVYDDTPWLGKDIPGKRNWLLAHPKISAAVAEKVGVKSARRLLLKNAGADGVDFGVGVTHEAFGQTESLTRRLKNIISLYPEGPQQLNELIQNADDANATIVRFVVSKKRYGTSSLLGQNLSGWQGPALYCYNDSTFSPQDFQNLSKIGQASKLEKLMTTGRFGLGFNSVFHWTDVPSFVSGDNLVMFDPHAKYVPGATEVSRGIKIRFTNTNLIHEFPDQFLPFCIFGNDMKQRFEGTLFRFPFRNEITASQSDISSTQCGTTDMTKELLENFRVSIQKVMLFLRHVKRVEVYVEEADDKGPQLLYHAEVVNRECITTNSSINTQRVTDKGWHAISNFISGSDSQPLSKEAFYNKLLCTPKQYLPEIQHLVTVSYIDYLTNSVEKSNEKNNEQDNVCNIMTDKFIICSSLGQEKCRIFACDPKHRDMKFVPWGSVAAHIMRNDKPAPVLKGNAFCFLPLPAETGFPVHINGYFELSANRRDIWFGSDMTGAGQIRSDWNQLLLQDVIAPLYNQVLLCAQSLLGFGESYDRLWPVNVSSEVWKTTRSSMYRMAEDLPLLYSPSNGGSWIKPKSAFLINVTIDDSVTDSNNFMKKLFGILLEENIRLVNLPSNVIKSMKCDMSSIIEVDSRMVREWYKEIFEHPSLSKIENASFLLSYCIEDLVDRRLFHELHGLPLLPLCNGSLGKITSSNMDYFYVATLTEKNLLEKASSLIVDVWSEEKTLNEYLKNEHLHEMTNLCRLNLEDFVKLLSHSYPPEWCDLPEVHWCPIQKSLNSSPENPKWLGNLWDYISSEEENEQQINISPFVNSLQIVPSLFGEGQYTLMKLTHNMAVINPINSNTGSNINTEVTDILQLIGIRILDVSVFQEKNKVRILRLMEDFIQPSTIHGIISAIFNSLPVDDDVNGIVGLVTARFKDISSTSKETLRSYLRDPRNLDDHDNLNDNEVLLLKTLPIYQVFNQCSEGVEGVYASLIEERFLPPSCADESHLDETFIKTVGRRDVDFLERLSVVRMTASSYYGSYLCQRIQHKFQERDRRTSAIIKLLQDLPHLSEDKNGKQLVTKLSGMKIIPNRCENIIKASDLYDPQIPGMLSLVDDSMLPQKELCQGNLLKSLHLLGMRTQLSSSGVLVSARMIQRLAENLSMKQNPTVQEIKSLQERALFLLNFLDDNDCPSMKKLLSENIFDEKAPTKNAVIDRKNNSQSSTLSEIEDSIRNTNGISFSFELNKISWLPVSLENNKVDGPPVKVEGLVAVGIASPRQTRPKADEWLCSYSFSSLCTNIKSDTLFKCFGWNRLPDISTVAFQLIALADLSESRDSLTYKQTLATVIPRIYEILNSQLHDAPKEDQEEVLILFREHPWIWVGDRFVTTEQVAFDAPENAKPYLYSVPNEMLCFDALLKKCCVRENFVAFDYINLLSSLHIQLGKNELSPRQLDLAIFVAKHLSRISEKIDKSKIYLPSQERVMLRAIDLTFDDAPWLSAIVKGKKTSRHIFVNNDIGVDTASFLGCKSLRDVLSAKGDGMVKIPCPKAESLSQLVSERDINSKEMCRVVQELLEIAEMKGTKQVSIALDRRSYGELSLLHPCLMQSQGTSLFLCFHDCVMDVEDIVKMTSPSAYYLSTLSGDGGCGGNGFPRLGRNLCGAFELTDCLQILSGNSFIIFDPNGEYLIEESLRRDHSIDKSIVQSHDTNTNEEEEVPNNESKVSTTNVTSVRGRKAAARNYGISYEFCNQFPDQFEPFLSLPLGVKESIISGKASGKFFFRGTILRLPLRSKDSPPSKICKQIFEEKLLDSFLIDLKKSLPKSFLFTYNLQCINLLGCLSNESQYKSILTSRVTSSPLERRTHLEDLNKTPHGWKTEKSRLKKLFNNPWVPEKSSYRIKISHRLNENMEDVTDTYILQSILAPPRLREMANTESLTSLNLLPACTLAVHIHRSMQTDNDISKYSLPEGTIFVGLDTGIKTGLPFFINLPLFLHEWSGNILLEKDDDNDFRKEFEDIRNVSTLDVSGLPQTRSLSLHVWNCQALTSTMNELIPSILLSIRDQINKDYSQNLRLLYRFWPYRHNIHPRFKALFDGNAIFKSLSSSEIYLTEKTGFQSISEGFFPSQEYTAHHQAASILSKHMDMFTVPLQIVEDLTSFKIKAKIISPSIVRKMLRNERFVQFFSQRPKEALTMLEYCLADFSEIMDFDLSQSAAHMCKTEFQGLCLIPLSDGTVGTFGRQMVVGSYEQQSMLKCLKNKFVSPFVIKKLNFFFTKPGFIDAIGLTQFGPKVLSEYISSVLPSSWEGKEFVQWSNPRSISDNKDNTTINDEEPSYAWMYQFWKEVSITDNDAVQLFRRWPLIPTTTGELASCANSRFIVCVSLLPTLTGREMYASLLEGYSHLSKLSCKSIDDTLNNVEENIIGFEKDFWNMGMPSITDESLQGENNDEIKIDLDSNDKSGLDEPELEVENEDDENISENHENLEPQHNVCNYDPSSPSFLSLDKLLRLINCPLLDASFYHEDDLKKILPSDFLSVSRVIMSVLNQCTNYWTVCSNELSRQVTRLIWSNLNSNDCDEFILLLSKPQDNRLSLMTSDLTMLKTFPLFETLSHDHTTLIGDDHFTVNSSVDIKSVIAYLPLSLQSKLLLDKPQFNELYQDLNVEALNEATILKKFVLPEFNNMTITQKESIIQNIMLKWQVLKVSNDFVSVLKETDFVKSKQHNDSHIIFVRADSLYDPRNEFISAMFDNDSTCFPLEEFNCESSLEMLSSLGLKKNVDKDIFLKCAWIVETEQCIPKALKLFKYYSENFANFHDSTQEFNRCLAQIRCVPAELEENPMTLYRFADTAAPKDKHLVFKVVPIMPEVVVPPQVLFSSLGITSPPSISTVLKQVRALTEDDAYLDHWTYADNVEEVFISLFSFLQDNYDDLSPRVQSGLRERPIVPIAARFVKANRLFFRLSKNLAPFFYEVPRAFGAYDVLLRELGVRDMPTSEDYAFSLIELNRDIGSGKLNANELKSAIDVVTLVANDIAAVSTDSILVPDSFGKLVSRNRLFQNDCPLLIQSQRLDLNQIHLVHPKLSSELCNHLNIGKLSERVFEKMLEAFVPKEILDHSHDLKRVEVVLKSDIFIDILKGLVPDSSSHILNLMKKELVLVETIKTRFLLNVPGKRNAVNVTNPLNEDGSSCFISQEKIYFTKPISGLTHEVVLAGVVCDEFNIDRKHVAGLSSVLSSDSSTASVIKQRMGLVEDKEQQELLRGEPGVALVKTDLDLIEIKPLKVFTKGEIIALREKNDDEILIYGVVLECNGGSLSHLRIRVGKGKEIEKLSSQVYSLRCFSKMDQLKSSDTSNDTSKPFSCNIIKPDCQNHDILESSLLVKEKTYPSIDKSNVLAAVEDLLKSTNMSLNDDAKNMMSSNLILQNELSQKQVYIDGIKKEGEKLSNNLSRGLDAFNCPITREVMKDPVICSDGHTYEREAIETWLRSNSRSPKTNEQLVSTTVIPNHTMRITIEAMSTNIKTISNFREKMTLPR